MYETEGEFTGLSVKAVWKTLNFVLCINKTNIMDVDLIDLTTMPRFAGRGQGQFTW